MSTKSSSLPTLDVVPTESLTGAGLLAGLAGALLYALYLLFVRGQALLATVLLPVVIFALISLWRGRSTGCRLSCYGGNWYYATRGGAHRQTVNVQGLVLPFLVQLFISDGARRWSYFIFHDSLDEDALKSLRRLLLLQR